MDERQAVGVVTVSAHSRLRDAPAVHLHAGAEGAHLALEERLLHLGDQLRRSDHHAADGDQLINVCAARRADVSAAQPKPHILIRARRRSPESHSKYDLLHLTLVHPACVTSPHGRLAWGKLTIKILCVGVCARTRMNKID